MKLVILKENLNDEKTIKQISEILRPLEFTRLDKLIEIVFDTTQDIQLESSDDSQSYFADEPNSENTEAKEILEKKEFNISSKRANFHELCIQKIESHLNINIIKKNRTSYQAINGQQGFVCCVSKPDSKIDNKYWFALRTHHERFLNKFRDAYLIYGCGSANNTFMIPLSFVQKEKDYLSVSNYLAQEGGNCYWHIVIYENSGRFMWRIPEKGIMIDIEQYRV